MSDKESNVVGFRKDYCKIYNDLRKLAINFGTLNAIDYSMCDLPFFGFTSEQIDRERNIYKRVKSAYDDLMSALKDACGMKDEM